MNKPSPACFWTPATLNGLRGERDLTLDVLYAKDEDVVWYNGRHYQRGVGGSWTTFETKGRPYTLITHAYLA